MINLGLDSLCNFLYNLRTIWNNHDRFVAEYFRKIAGKFFTGDGAYKDCDSYYWIQGRVDDVINVSGHRIGSAEIESAICASGICLEAAALGRKNDIKGQEIYIFCCLKIQDSELKNVRDVISSSYWIELEQQLKTNVKNAIGAFAIPAKIIPVSDLPKTRSGKIMRRILRKLLENQPLGDLSTLSNPEVIGYLIETINFVL